MEDAEPPTVSHPPLLCLQKDTPPDPKPFLRVSATLRQENSDASKKKALPRPAARCPHSVVVLIYQRETLHDHRCSKRSKRSRDPGRTRAQRCSPPYAKRAMKCSSKPHAGEGSTLTDREYMAGWARAQSWKTPPKSGAKPDLVVKVQRAANQRILLLSVRD